MLRTALFLLTVVQRLAGALKTGDPQTVQMTATTVYNLIEVEKLRVSKDHGVAQPGSAQGS